MKCISSTAQQRLDSYQAGYHFGSCTTLKNRSDVLYNVVHCKYNNEALSKGCIAALVPRKAMYLLG